MNKKASIWGSIGLLIGVVIAILALVLGAWQLPLLTGAFAMWGLWLLWTQALPFHRDMQAQRQREQAECFNRSLAQTLLYHVNYRVSACLKAGYPDARWEWMMRDPVLFVAQGGTGRIRVYGIQDYESWYEAHGRNALKKLVSDLDSRGHSALTMQEDGSVCICPKGDGKEVKQGLLDRFPPKASWPKLAKLLEMDGLAATVWDNCITVTW